MSEERMGEQNNETEQRHAPSEQERERAIRVAEQVARMPNDVSFVRLSGVSSQEAIEQMASALASKPRRDRIADFWTMDDAIDIANAIRESGLREITVIADLVRLNNRHERELAALRAELADLRAAQSVPLTCAHPYRSGPQRPAVPAGCPVDASEAEERVEGRPGALRRVYGALSGRASDVCFALVPVLGGVSVYLTCSAGGADAIGVAIGMAFAGIGSVVFHRGQS